MDDSNQVNIEDNTNAVYPYGLGKINSFLIIIFSSAMMLFGIYLLATGDTVNSDNQLTKIYNISLVQIISILGGGFGILFGYQGLISRQKYVRIRDGKVTIPSLLASSSKTILISEILSFDISEFDNKEILTLKTVNKEIIIEEQYMSMENYDRVKYILTGYDSYRKQDNSIIKNILIIVGVIVAMFIFVTLVAIWNDPKILGL